LQLARQVLDTTFPASTPSPAGDGAGEREAAYEPVEDLGHGWPLELLLVVVVAGVVVVVP
jgi:hypothetical protein